MRWCTLRAQLLQTWEATSSAGDAFTHVDAGDGRSGAAAGAAAIGWQRHVILGGVRRSSRHWFAAPPAMAEKLRPLRSTRDPSENRPGSSGATATGTPPTMSDDARDSLAISTCEIMLRGTDRARVWRGGRDGIGTVDVAREGCRPALGVARCCSGTCIRVVGS